MIIPFRTSMQPWYRTPCPLAPRLKSSPSKVGYHLFFFTHDSEHYKRRKSRSNHQSPSHYPQRDRPMGSILTDSANGYLKSSYTRAAYCIVIPLPPGMHNPPCTIIPHTRTLLGHSLLISDLYALRFLCCLFTLLWFSLYFPQYSVYIIPLPWLWMLSYCQWRAFWRCCTLKYDQSVALALILCRPPSRSPRFADADQSSAYRVQCW